MMQKNTPVAQGRPKGKPTKVAPTTVKDPVSDDTKGICEICERGYCSVNIYGIKIFPDEKLVPSSAVADKYSGAAYKFLTRVQNLTDEKNLIDNVVNYSVNDFKLESHRFVLAKGDMFWANGGHGFTGTDIKYICGFVGCGKIAMFDTLPRFVVELYSTAGGLFEKHKMKYILLTEDIDVPALTGYLGIPGYTSGVHEKTRK